MGGGAAGFFAAINTVSNNPDLRVLIIEKNKEALQKVKVSGGGRCNVTHDCFQASELIKNYPRGKEFLLKPFERFGPNETIAWFNNRGVGIKKEADGRMFPASNTSQTILDLFHDEVKRLGIELRCSERVTNFEKEEDSWKIDLLKGESLRTGCLMLATGSDRTIWESLKKLDLEIVAPVPSLFTFKIEDEELRALAGNSFLNSKASIPDIETTGPALITHWGMSGPSILKLSAFAARELEKKNYVFKLKMDFLPELSDKMVLEHLKNFQTDNPKKKVLSTPLFDLSKRFWEFLCKRSNVGEFQNWSETGKKHFKLFQDNLKKMVFDVTGKSTFKEEFVTAGGVALSEVNPDTFEVIKHPTLFMAGEVLNIDAITGGFNFQAAWTGGWHVAKGISKIKT
ncbi:aminoacetone oxidase family FAD-binding enzyme [Arcticibacterium luteifluviistationis]|uniref:aminoacetone oxidase family FAD-binding enzyme n=1 Tax=Arcticibacterium luteifluviistationis TaxID=1784714 RepID=UPI00195513FF|nr:aminoacetone oxidase family FAD-binding enzyme [Arcticibacterium luteifluviistationis]